MFSNYVRIQEERWHSRNSDLCNHENLLRRISRALEREIKWLSFEVHLNSSILVLFIQYRDVQRDLTRQWSRLCFPCNGNSASRTHEFVSFVAQLCNPSHKSRILGSIPTGKPCRADSSPLSILNPGQIFPLWRPLITRTCVGGLTANLFAGNGAEGGAQQTPRLSLFLPWINTHLEVQFWNKNCNNYGHDFAKGLNGKKCSSKIQRNNCKHNAHSFSRKLCSDFSPGSKLEIAICSVYYVTLSRFDFHSIPLSPFHSHFYRMGSSNFVWLTPLPLSLSCLSLSCLSHSSFSQCSLQGCEIVHTWYCCCRIRPNFGLKLSYFFFPLQKEPPQLPLSQVDVSPVWWVSLISTIDEKIAVSTREQIQ